MLPTVCVQLDAFTFADERRKMAAGAAFTDAFGEATEEEYDSGDVALLAAAAADRWACMRTTLLHIILHIIHPIFSCLCVRTLGWES